MFSNVDISITEFFDAVKCGIVIIDPDILTIIYANNEALSIIGHEKDKLINKACTNYFCKHTQGSCPVLTNDVSLKNYETFITRSDGSVVIINKNVDKVIYNNKSYFVESFIDITELKKNEHRIHSLLKLSESQLKSEKEIAKFALTEAVKLTNSKIGYLHLINNISGDNTLDIFTYVSLDESTPICKMSKDQYHLLSNNLMWADCIKTKTPKVDNNYTNDNIPIDHFIINRHLVVPVINGNDEIVAVMGVGNKSTDYTDFDIEQLQLFANSSWQIIKRKRLDNALSCSESKYKTLLENSPAAVYEIDISDNNYKIINVGGAIEKLTGFTKDELLSMNALYLLTPSSQKQFIKYINKLSTCEDEKHEIEFNIVTKTGHTKRILIKANCSKKKDGRTIAYVVAIDLTPLKILEQKAKIYLEIAPAIFVILDKNANILFINNFGMKVLECDDSVFGKNWFDVFIEKRDYKDVYNVFTKLINGDDSFSIYENKVKTLKGNLRIIQWHNTVLKDESNEIIEVIGAGHDITQEKLRELELEKQWKKEEDRLRKNLRPLTIFNDATSLGV